MTQKLRVFAAVGVGLVTVATANPATAQKAGGILRSYSIDSPASMSIHEEVTIYALRPAMGVFNNLVKYDQHVKQNSMQSIVPDSGQQLDLGRGRQTADLQIARGRQVA
jgi:peptide/nickel transport system substrate-binding protein